MLPSTADRVKVNTSCSVNEAIRQATERRLARLAAAGPHALERRLRELDQEWDIERCLETMAPTISLVGLALSFTTDRRFLAIPLVVQAFFLMHALQGWCPPLPVLRSFGVRTMEEIDAERTAIKALRGDFRQVQRSPEAAFEAAEA